MLAYPAGRPRVAGRQVHAGHLSADGRWGESVYHDSAASGFNIHHLATLGRDWNRGRAHIMGTVLAGGLGWTVPGTPKTRVAERVKRGVITRSYVAAMADVGLAVATLQRLLTSISVRHRLAKLKPSRPPGGHRASAAAAYDPAVQTGRPE
jgi:hypothetical protein